jgi:hypothetical protein
VVVAPVLSAVDVFAESNFPLDSCGNERNLILYHLFLLKTLSGALTPLFSLNFIWKSMNQQGAEG